jgi:hypothetical protein
MTPTCGSCPNLDHPIETGVALCHAQLMWRGPEERVEGCSEYGQAAPRFTPATVTREAVIRDLLDDPRHSVSDKDRRWLRAELKPELAA